MTDRQRPGVWKYLTYSYGAVLPPSMHAWVVGDLTGPGAVRRTVIRFSIPCALFLAPLLLIDTTIVVLMSMTLPIFIPFVYFAFALNKVYRRSRLARHGLDPDLVDERARIRDAPAREAYHARYRGADPGAGARPPR